MLHCDKSIYACSEKKGTCYCSEAVCSLLQRGGGGRSAHRGYVSIRVLFSESCWREGAALLFSDFSLLHVRERKRRRKKEKVLKKWDFLFCFLKCWILSSGQCYEFLTRHTEVSLEVTWTHRCAAFLPDNNAARRTRCVAWRMKRRRSPSKASKKSFLQIVLVVSTNKQHGFKKARRPTGRRPQRKLKSSSGKKTYFELWTLISDFVFKETHTQLTRLR